MPPFPTALFPLFPTPSSRSPFPCTTSPCSPSFPPVAPSPLPPQIDELENALNVARRQIDTHRKEIAQQQRAMEAQQEVSTRLLLEQQEEVARALVEAVRGKDAEMEREIDELENALIVARKQIDTHRREIAQQQRAMEAQQEASTRLLLEQQEAARALVEAVGDEDAEMEREVGVGVGASLVSSPLFPFPLCHLPLLPLFPPPQIDELENALIVARKQIEAHRREIAQQQRAMEAQQEASTRLLLQQEEAARVLVEAIDELENALIVARRQIDTHRREIAQQQRAMEAQQEASTRLLLEQQEEAARALVEAVRGKDAEMEREVGALLGALRGKEERMRGEIEELQDKMEERDAEIGRLARRLERAAKDMEDIIAANAQQVETQKNVIEMLAESSRDARQKLAAMEERALAAERMVETFVEASSLEEVQSMVDDMPAVSPGSLDTSPSVFADVSMRSNQASVTSSSLATSDAELERMTAVALAIGSGNRGNTRQYMGNHHPSSSSYIIAQGDSQQLVQQQEQPYGNHRPRTAPANRQPIAVRSLFEGISGAFSSRMGGAVPGATSLPRTQP
ncbi:unnamed protein product [Closterium sp. NIES-54]